LRNENLAALYQEILTAVVRLREGRQPVTDARVFRNQIQEALNLASKGAAQQGYSNEGVRLATFAVVAFVDESVLNQQLPVFSEWVQRPLQQEIFGVHVAGEIFFENVRRLLAQPDSQEITDLLEVYYLCLLLGYRGKYGAGREGELSGINGALAAKIGRTRVLRDFSPAWGIPKGESVPVGSDPWVRRLLLSFAGCLILTVLLFVAFKWSLRSGMTAVESETSQAQRAPVR
jgi:type VI secretion system protein ImpK